MQSDIALIGTGLAPLIAAKRLLDEGRSVVILNPDADFFEEDSELPFDPLWPSDSGVSIDRLRSAVAENAVKELGPDFPGALETWPAPSGYRDASAPCLRTRSRLWIQRQLSTGAPDPNWLAIENLFVEAGDAGFNPQELDGILALRKFPGVTTQSTETTRLVDAAKTVRGIFVPRLCEVDVDRYRNGVLEFIRERLGRDRVICGVSQLGLIPGGLKFHANAMPRTARMSEALVFWTPRITQWLTSFAKKVQLELPMPRGVRLLEQWSLISRESLDPGIIASIDRMAVWAEAEGTPPDAGKGEKVDRLSVLQRGALVPIDALERRWASQESMAAMFRLCFDFLRWDKFSVRAMKTRAILEWPGEWSRRSRENAPLPPPCVEQGGLRVRIVMGCDGPLVDVVRSAREAL